MKPFLSRARARATAVTGALLALGLTVTGAAAATSAAAAAEPAPPMIEPVVDANFPDPDILLVDGVYHAYATNNAGQNVQHRTSTDLVTWSEPTDAAPDLGAWVSEACSFSPGGATDRCVWAPEVAAVEGGYALYYTARDATSPRQCLGVSLSDSPEGPFEPIGDDPFICPNGEDGTEDLGGAIDAGTFHDGEQLWLLWKADGNCCAGKAAILFAQPLSADGTELTGPPTELIRVDRPNEGIVVEAPTMVERDGTYYLLYSANDFYGGNYRTAYATSDSVLGPWTKATTELMTSDRFAGDVRGPGGQDVVERPDGSTAIVFHGWNERFTYRAMYMSELEWSDGVPSVTAASDRYQAEDGVVENARVVQDGSASGGAKVGGMDFADSSVSVEVWADEAGPALLGIRYGNGSMDDGERVASTSTLAVNGQDAGVVTFAHTTWGNWQTAEQLVDLTAGWNTVTLTRGTFFAEIDAFDVFPTVREPQNVVPPVIPADAERYEFEDGVVVRGSVGSASGASGGEKVGGLDFNDSSVTLEVEAEEAGPYTLAIRFANGSERGGYTLESSDVVTVNGEDAGVVTFPHTTWGNWQSVAHEVQLQEGTNTVTLTRQTWYTELDALDVYPSEQAPAEPEVTVQAQTRCLGGTPYVAVRATNDGDATVGIMLSTPHGEKALTAVDPGRNAYQSFKVRGPLEAGEATVTVTTADGATSEITAAYAAASCG